MNKAYEFESKKNEIAIFLRQLPNEPITVSGKISTNELFISQGAIYNNPLCGTSGRKLDLLQAALSIEVRRYVIGNQTTIPVTIKISL